MSLPSRLPRLFSMTNSQQLLDTIGVFLVITYENKDFSGKIRKRTPKLGGRKPMSKFNRAPN